MVQVHVPQGVEVRVLSWAPPDTKNGCRKTAIFLLAQEAMRLRASREDEKGRACLPGRGRACVTVMGAI